MTEHFLGQGIATGSAGADGVVQLWNPPALGVNLRVSAMVISAELLTQGVAANYWGDLRRTTSALGVPMGDGEPHVSNKLIDGPAPKAEVRIATTNVNSYPYNRPIHEFWLGATRDDRLYTFDPPIIIPPGRGLAVCMAKVTCIASFQWSEEAIPPVLPPGSLPGALVGNMANMPAMRDGNEATYATSSSDADFVTIGVDLGEGNASPLTRAVFRSPLGRSFCGATPPRALTISYGVDGTTFTPIGSMSDAAQTSQAIIDLSGLSLPSSRYHWFKISNPALAGWRVAEMVLYG